ncbi:MULTISPECIES: hypothetical protein [Photorhabdus]|uniref:hypothetical protein n=1 Tax=Photorhabdus TaxID=29487 RepID=UPI00069B419C|nr:hypothetical protein [Photorhabdus thracensis]
MDKIIKFTPSYYRTDGNYVTVHVAKPGTKLNNPDGTTGTSLTGHIWMTIETSSGQKTDVGWSTGDSLKVGGYDNISLNDSALYDKSTVKSYTTELINPRMSALIDCINKVPLGEFPGFSKNYNLFTNNCITFVKTCLNYVGFNMGNSLLPNFTPSGNYRSLAQMIEKNYNTADEWGDQWTYMNNDSNLSPLVIDLNGDGVGTIPEGEIYFDMNNDGISDSIGWIDKNDGFLVYDKNNDGKIESGGKLFGNYSEINGENNFKNGFEALSELDSNNDSIISKCDKEWSKLKIWKDENSNGIVDKNELMSLPDVGIKEINLKYQEEFYIDKSGNK